MYKRQGLGIKPKFAFGPVRVGITGKRVSPPLFESMTFPEPVIQVAIEPKTKGDQEKLGTAIQKLAEEDPTFQVCLLYTSRCV